MNKKVKKTTKGSVTIIEPAARLDGMDAGTLDEELYACLGRGYKLVIINMAEVEWISSSGLAILVHHSKKFNDVSGRFVLCNLTRRIESILVISKLASVFDTYDSLDTALASFQSQTTKP